jgi:hypothetical protein
MSDVKFLKAGVLPILKLRLPEFGIFLDAFIFSNLCGTLMARLIFDPVL